MTEQQIWIISAIIAVVLGGIDLWGEKNQKDIVRRVTMVQWLLVFLMMGWGMHFARVTPKLSEYFTIAAVVLTAVSVYSGIKAGPAVAEYLERRARRRAISEARKEVLPYG